MNSLDDLTRAFLSDDPSELDRAVVTARQLARTGDRTGLLALEEAIRRKSGNPECQFYSPGPRALAPGAGERAVSEIKRLALQGRLFEDPAQTQSLLSSVATAAAIGLIGTTLQGLMMEIGAAAGKEQRDAFQLLATHTMVSADLIRSTRQ